LLSEERTLFHDPQLCSACGFCAIVCAYRHYGTLDPDRGRIHPLLSLELPDLVAVSYCSHCKYAFCEAACPSDPKAIYRDPATGAVCIDPIRCIGCRSCVYACPVSAPRYIPELHVSHKCDLCGGDPLCVKCCPTGALQYLPRNEIRRLVEAS